MPHHPLSILLKHAFSSVVDEDPAVAEALAHRRASRRQFLRDTLITAGGLTLGGGLALAGSQALAGGLTGAGSRKAPSGKRPSVAIIGAGIAGLNACYQLKKQGIIATVYEASNRVGGRMYTLKDKMGEGITTDIGGEFVDTTHTDIRQLADELTLPMYNLREDTLIPKTFYFGGKKLGQQDLRTALAPFVPRLVKDIASLPEKPSHATADAFRHLDNLSITEYLSGIGISGWLYDFLNVVLTREYGMEASEQSAVNFLIMFEPPSESNGGPSESNGDYELFGNDHEVLKIKGGSQQLTNALFERIKDQVLTGYRLKALSAREPLSAEKPAGYDLVFETAGQLPVKQDPVKADYVLLAIPFTILRNITLSVDMPQEKRKCIDEIGYGNSCKFIMGTTGKPWRAAGDQGYTFTDLSFGCGWDSSQRQSENHGSFTVFGGGHFADHVNSTNEESLAAEFLPALERIYPGSTEAWNHRLLKFCWASNPHSRAAYSSFKKGQWSTIAGWEGVPLGDIYFAGEHVSLDFQGYMNGGAKTGREAAALIAEKIHKNIDKQQLS